MHDVTVSPPLIQEWETLGHPSCQVPRQAINDGTELPIMYWTKEHSYILSCDLDDIVWHYLSNYLIDLCRTRAWATLRSIS